MSKIALEGNASGTGTFTIASPNSNSNYTLTLPSSTGTVVVTGGAQTIEFAAGSAASPSITFTGDTNTGIFSPGADTIAFSEGGAEAMRIDSSGNVGIGTNSPTQRLDVVAANSQIHFGAATTGGGYLMSTANGQFRISGGAVWDGSNWIAKSTTASIIGDDATGDIKFLSNTSLTAGNSFTPTERMRIDSSGNVGIGTTSPSDRLQVNGASAANTQVRVVSTATAAERSSIEFFNNTVSRGRVGGANDFDGLTLDSSTTESAAVIRFRTGGGTLTERARITSDGVFAVGKTSTDSNTVGASMRTDGYCTMTRSANKCLDVNRQTNDGTLVSFLQDNTEEGSISVSGTTVSYNGGHLSRWAQTQGPKDDTLVKGTVLSNLDEMNVYTDAEGNPVPNEQLNKVKVSDVEGDVNVAGVFVNWSYDEQHQVDEINMAMTGDMIIRIAQGVVVQKGDLLMSAGDGTAKPQGDDIVRSKTVAKVTSNHVTCTYEDGSYCVPCVLMAC